MPAELIFLQATESLELVLGGATTSLMTAQFIGGRKKVLCIDQIDCMETASVISTLGIPSGEHSLAERMATTVDAASSEPANREVSAA
jgi:hypothetical protein